MLVNTQRMSFNLSIHHLVFYINILLMPLSQNGISESKHCHIVDTALTLISESSLPLTYWVYAFSTVMFLINRLSSPNLQFTSPWQRLFGSLRDYDSFKNFGCACFPLLRPCTYNTNILLLYVDGIILFLFSFFVEEKVIELYYGKTAKSARITEQTCGGASSIHTTQFGKLISNLAKL